MSACDANLLDRQGHLDMFNVGPTHVRFSCRFCGATTEPFRMGEGLPADFRGVPHVPSCLVIANVAYGDRRAA